jgi:hypothetical protein
MIHIKNYLQLYRYVGRLLIDYQIEMTSLILLTIEIFHTNWMTCLAILKRVYHRVKWCGEKAQRELTCILGVLSSVSTLVMALRVSAC